MGGDFMRWTADRQKLLADLSAHGLSAGEIALTMGETRAAVATAMWRYGCFARSKIRNRPCLSGRLGASPNAIWTPCEQ